MTTRPPKPADRPWMSPYLALADVSRSIDFYERAFGFELFETRVGPEGVVDHATLQWHDLRLMIGTAHRPKDGGAQQALGWTPNALGGVALVVYVYTEDVDALHKRAVEAGAREGFAPDDMYWGDRVCLLYDLDGHAWNFATNRFDYEP